MADPYDVLGVPRDAKQEDIRKAYRRLAKKNHPDLNPGDAEAEKRFKEISAANAILSDEDKRKRFDAGQIDETGAERPQPHHYRHYAEDTPDFKYYRWNQPEGSDDFGDIFGDLFGRTAGGRERRSVNARGADVNYTLSVDFLEAVNGAKKTVTLPDGSQLTVTIPPGIKDEQTLRLKGKGRPGVGEGGSGDALVTVHVGPHAMFSRDGDTIRSSLDITLGEALSGGKVRAPTVSGAVNVSVPQNANTGDTLRLRGKGVVNRATGKRGDHLIELRIKLPEAADDELRAMVADWEARHPYNPRDEKEAVS